MVNNSENLDEYIRWYNKSIYASRLSASGIFNSFYS